jgi:hypothetical protein
MLLISLRSLPSNPAYAGEDGKMILFGPYVSLSAGEYKIAFSLKTDKQVDEPVVKIDVVANKALKVFASQEIKGTDFRMPDKYQNFDLYFDTTGEKDFEFRVRLLRDSNISVNIVGITQLKKWPVEQIVGGNMLKGSGKVNIITDEESLLGSLKFVELKTDDSRFKRNAGWSALESKAQVNQTTKPVSLSSKASLPKTTTGFVLFLIIVLVVSCAFILTGIFVLKGDVGQNDKSVKPKVRGRGKLTDFSLKQKEDLNLEESQMNIESVRVLDSTSGVIWKRSQKYNRVKQFDSGDHLERQLRISKSLRSVSISLAMTKIVKLAELGKSRIAVFLQEAFNVAKNLSARHFIILGLLNTIIIFVFFENTFFFSSSNMIGYLLVLYIALSLIWKINSKVSIVAALLLLMSCPFFLISDQEQLAENVAVYVYYFLVIGVFLQLKEYVLEEKIPARETEKSEIPCLSLQVEGETILVTRSPRSANVSLVMTNNDSLSVPTSPGEAILKTCFEQSEETRNDRKEEICDSFSGAKYRVEELRKRKRKVKRHRLIILVVLLSVSLLATGIFLWMRLSGKPEKKNKSVFQLPVKTNNSRLDRKRKELPVNKGEIKIEVLNGNGIKGKALTVENLLKSNGFNVLNTGNADNFNYVQTVIRYKKGKKEIAGLIDEVISSMYSPVFQEDIVDDSETDVVIILGKK